MSVPDLLGLLASENNLIWYYRYSPSVRAEIGKYAAQHGVAAAARFYSQKLDHIVSETTASSLKKAYLQGVREKRDAEDNGDVTQLPLEEGRFFS